jgi:hypothetical protein
MPEVASLLNTSKVNGKGFNTMALQRFPNLQWSAKASDRSGHNRS